MLNLIIVAVCYVTLDLSGHAVGGDANKDGLSVDELVVDKRHWVDPSDMLKFDISSNKYRASYHSGGPRELPSGQDDAKPSDGSLVHSPNNQRTAEQCPNGALSATFLKHFVRTLLARLRSVGGSPADSLEVSVDVALSPSELRVLRRFLDDGEGTTALAQDTVQILERMVQTVHRRNVADVAEGGAGLRVWSWLRDLLPLLNVVLLVPCVAVLLHHTLTVRHWRRLAGSLVLFGFFLDVVWTYVHMYKDVLIDPLWEVPLMEAVTRSVVNCVVSPADLVARAFSSFFAHLHKDLPVQLQLVVIPFFIVVLVILLMFACRYRVQVLFGLLRIEPMAHWAPPVHAQPHNPPVEAPPPAAANVPVLRRAETLPEVGCGRKPSRRMLTPSIREEYEGCPNDAVCANFPIVRKRRSKSLGR